MICGLIKSNTASELRKVYDEYISGINDNARGNLAEFFVDS